MNKDVIYIEPEDDITDILSNLKNAKNKIVALVPPKKAGVLRSAVNFKLIAKTATKANKTVVLITADDALRKLAGVVKMPVAKTLQSKPEIPGVSLRTPAKKTDDDVIEEEKPAKVAEGENAEEAEDDAADEVEEEKEAPVVTKSAKKEKAESAEPEIEIDGAEEDAKDEKAAKKAQKEKDGKLKVPNFKKIRLPIILGSVGAVALICFLFWANVIAPAADITVKVKTNPISFGESVRFTTNENEKDIASGVFYVEEKTVEKSDEVEFEATGEKDKGAKATGTIMVERPEGEIVSCSGADNYFTIPKGMSFTYNGKKYVTTVDGSANIPDGSSEYIQMKTGSKNTCTLKKPVSSGQIAVEAEKPGEDYNVGGSASGWSNATVDSYGYRIIGSDMQGGTSEKVKVVKEEDVDNAKARLKLPIESEIRQQLSQELGSDYVVIDGSYKVEKSEVTVTPEIDNEVEGDKKPTYKKKETYRIYAVSAKDLNEFIEKKLESQIGDDTQRVYATGIDDGGVFIDSFKAEDMTGKVKSKSAKTGPKITEEEIAQMAYGERTGNLYTKLRSLNGVQDVKIETSYFWVAKIPSEAKKQKVTVTLKID